MTNVENFNDQGRSEEILNAISHGLGGLLAIGGTAVMLVFAAGTGAVMDMVSASVYCFGLIFLYVMSTLYHSMSRYGAKRIFQKLDHCSIFVLIVGSYAPVCLSLLGGKLGWIIFSVNLFLALLGIVANAISVKKWSKVSLLLYLLMGWSVLAGVKPLMQLISFNGFLLLLLGGLFYSIGVIFYTRKKPRYMHTVWHLFVLTGSCFHYFFILFYIF
ncbi:MAG: hemolysin-III related [Bacillota bacterium]|jgi:hemolysin III|nr:hemolysin-III related [Bacillota bacterium]